MAMGQAAGDLNPDYVATAEFNLARRGYEPAEVRALLREVADNLARLHAREEEFGRRLAEAEAAKPPAPSIDDIDEADLTAILGEKTTQVLQSARDAAADIHRRAVEKARDLIDQTTADVQRMRAEAEGTLRSAKERAEEVERKADQRAKQVTQAAASEAGRARADSEQTLRTARMQAEEITAEAEKAAGVVTAAADEHASRSRAKSETLITTARAEAEAIEAETQARVAQVLRETEEAIAANRADADTEISRLLAAAEADAERMRLDAEQRAQHTEEEGRVAGRRLVAEAMAAREQVLRDLARHRRNAQVHLGQLRVGRERLLEAYAVVRATADQAVAELDDVVDEARLAAEAAVDERTSDETKLSLEQLEAEFGLDRLRSVPVLQATDDADREGTDASTTLEGNDTDAVATARHDTGEDAGEDAEVEPEAALGGGAPEAGEDLELPLAAATDAAMDTEEDAPSAPTRTGGTRRANPRTASATAPAKARARDAAGSTGTAGAGSPAATSP